MVSTSHMTPGIYPFDWELYQNHFQQAQKYCQVKGYNIHLYTGAELLYTMAMDALISTHRLTTSLLNDFVLLEYSPMITLQDITHSLQTLEKTGYNTIIAYVQRYYCLNHMNSLAKLRKQFPSTRFKINANSILKKHGLINDLHIKHWLEQGEIDYVASDAHHPIERPFLNWKACQMLKHKLTKDYVMMLFGQS